MREYKALEKLVHFLKQQNTIERRFCVGAIALDSRGRVLSIRTNEYFKTHPKMAYLAFKHQNQHKIYLHAEVAAIISASQHQTKKIATLIVARITKDGIVTIAKPCSICQCAAREAKVKRLFYTDRLGNLILLN